MPRSIVPVSTRTMKFTVSPSVVVVFATSAGRLVVLGSGLNADAAAPRPRPAPPVASAAGAAGGVELRYTYCTTVFAEQFSSSGAPSVVPSGSLKTSVWQMKGVIHGPENTGPVIG